MDQETKTVSTMSNSDLIDIMWQGLNKSSLKGVFNINESYLLKLVHARLLENVGGSSKSTSTPTITSDSMSQ